MDDPVDRLVDTLLREEAGGELPPDLSARILARAEARRRRRAAWRWGMAAAAVAGVVLGVWMTASWRYPPPVLTGYELVDQPLERGIVISPERETAVLTLGGYCTVRATAGSEIQWTGEPRAEAIALKGGMVECRVEAERGSFEVRTAAGVVRALGTHFYVKALPDRGGPTSPKRICVKVAEGMVMVSGEWGGVTLGAGEETTAPPRARPEAGAPARNGPAATIPKTPTMQEKPPAVREGKLKGILAGRSGEYIFVKEEGQGEPRKYGPVRRPEGLDKELLERLKKIPVGNLVEIEWRWAEHYRVKAIELVVPAEREGATTGVVTGRGDWWLDVKPEDGGPTERYTARWAGGRDGGPDKEQMALIGGAPEGSRVRVEWTYEERKTLTGLAVLAKAADKAAPAR